MRKIQIPFREDNFFGILFLLVLVIPLAFSFFLYESFEILKFGFLGLFLSLAFLVWAGRKRVAEEQKWYGNRIFLFFILAFIFWSLLAVGFSWDKYLAIFGFYPRFTNGFIFLILWLLLILAFGLLSWEKRKSLLKLLAITGGIVALWGLFQSARIGYYQGYTTEFFIRAPSFLGNPNFAAMYVSALLPLQVVFFSLSRKFITKILFGLSIFLSIWSVVVLTSRGALLSMFVALLVGLLISVAKRQKRLGGIFLASIILSFFLFSIFWNLSRPGSVQNSISLQESNIQQRFAIWGLTAEAIYKRPFVGAGLSNFPLIYEREKTSSGVLNVGIYDDPHNLILMLASTGGIPLVVFFLGLIGTGIFVGFKNCIKNSNLEILAVLSGTFAWLIGSMFNPVAIPCYVVLALFLSCMFADSALALPKYLYNVRVRGLIATVFASLGLGFVIFLTSEHLFGAGMREYKSGKFAEANKHLLVAFKLNPFVFLHGLYAAGGAVLSDENTTNTLKIISRASKIHSNWSINTSGIANVYYLLFWKTRDVNLIPIIRQHVQKSLMLNPYSQYDTFIAAQFEYVFGNIDQAIIYAKRSVVLYPSNPKQWLLLGKLYQEMGQRSQMIYSLEKAKEYAPEVQPQFKMLWEAALKEKDVKKFNFKVQLGLGGLD